MVACVTITFTRFVLCHFFCFVHLHRTEHFNYIWTESVLPSVWLLISSWSAILLISLLLMQMTPWISPTFWLIRTGSNLICTGKSGAKICVTSLVTLVLALCYAKCRKGSCFRLQQCELIFSFLLDWWLCALSWGSPEMFVHLKIISYENNWVPRFDDDLLVVY